MRQAYELENGNEARIRWANWKMGGQEHDVQENMVTAACC